MSEKGDKLRSLDREVKGYLKPPTHRLFNGYIGVNEMGKSEGINLIVRDFFSKMTDEERSRYANYSKHGY